MTSGWRRAQARAARRLAKKLIYPQERSAAGRQASPAEPANTTAARPGNPDRGAGGGERVGRADLTAVADGDRVGIGELG